jgi:hypothetical protein
VLYAASSISLACLEILAHAQDFRMIPHDYTVTTIKVPWWMTSCWSEKHLQALMAGFLRMLPPDPEFMPLGTAERGLIELATRRLGDMFCELTSPSTHNIRYYFRRALDWWFNGPSEPFTCFLAVPSVVVPTEWNYVINPRSRAYRFLRWSEPVPLRFDPRIVGTE